jgi:hypothetical protein
MLVAVPISRPSGKGNGSGYGGGAISRALSIGGPLSMGFISGRDGAGGRKGGLRKPLNVDDPLEPDEADKRRSSVGWKKDE